MSSTSSRSASRWPAYRPLLPCLAVIGLAAAVFPPPIDAAPPGGSSLPAVSAGCDDSAGNEAPRSYEFEVTLLEIEFPAEVEPQKAQLNAAELLQGKPAVGKVLDRQAWRLRLLEGAQSRIQFGGEEGVVVGQQQPPRGAFAGNPQQLIQRVALGSILEATASRHDDGQVLVDYSLEQTRLAPDPDAPGGAPKQITACKSTVALTPNTPELLGGMSIRAAPSAGGVTRAMVLIGVITAAPEDK